MGTGIGGISDDIAAHGQHPLLPPHCVNVFVPLVDITAHNGGTEFCLGSHKLTVDGGADVMWQDSGHKDAIGFDGTPVAPTFCAGSVLLFDYRVLHRGLAHEGLPNERRPVLYFTYARRWFFDTENFPQRNFPVRLD